MKKLLWVGDAACPSGFAKATHGILDNLSSDWDITVLGINYRGDPHNYRYPIYAAAPGGDSFGIGRLIWMMDVIKPDVAVIQQDPWNFPSYLRQINAFKEYKNTPIIGAVAVDGLNCLGNFLNDLSFCVFWTQFGANEAVKGGYKGSFSVIPLAVDLDMYSPMDRLEARKKLGFPSESKDFFIVGNINRNQPRKRLDLMIKYFAKWEKDFNVKDAALFLHVAPTGDDGYDLQQLAKYYGVRYFLHREPAVFYGVSEEEMRMTYCALDLCANSGQGEGFGLPAFEASACKIPYLAGRWSALAELLDGCAHLVSCPTTIATHGKINSIGGIPDEQEFIDGLQKFYTDRSYGEKLADKAFNLVHQERFTWTVIGEQWNQVLESICMRKQLRLTDAN